MMRRIFLFLLLSIVAGGNLCAQVHDVPQNTVKATFLSIFSGSPRLTYERALTEHTSAEITCGMIGMGYDMLNDVDPLGYVVKAAYKYTFFGRQHDASALNGFYVKPEVQWANFVYANKGHSSNAKMLLYELPCRNHVSRWSIMAEGGWQHLFGRFVVDIYVGLGYSWGGVNEDNYYHGVMMFPHYDSHLAVTGGCRLGYAF